ncbi:MAG: SGNH/GDSL hydrolase family protein [Marmoricola sp.]
MASWIRRACAPIATLAVVASLLTFGAPAGAVTASTPTRIMLYGDSITQGTSAHYTWRYRLWQGLQAGGNNVDFVGPMNTVFTYPGYSTTSTEYRDPNFDTAHAAVAGMTLTKPVWTISQLAGTYRPDAIVGLIGFNDLRTSAATIPQLIDTWRTQIQAARRADPGVSIVLAEYGETWGTGLSDYDSALTSLATELDQPRARVVATGIPQLNEHTDTFDGVHLTTSGEKIEAASVAGALAQLGLPSGATPADASVNAGSYAPTPTLTATASSGVSVSWSSVDYASSMDIVAQDVGTGGYGMKRFVTGTSTTLGGQPGHTYKIWLFPVQGWWDIGTYSAPLTITVPTS